MERAPADCACKIRGRVTVPPPTAGIVSYSGAGSALDGGRDPDVRSHSTKSKELPSSSKESSSSSSSSSCSSVAPIVLESDASSARSARPLLGTKRLPKLRKTLLAGRPSGRRPYVGSKFSRSGSEDVDVSAGVGGGGGESGEETCGANGRADCDRAEPATEEGGLTLLVPSDDWDDFRLREGCGIGGAGGRFSRNGASTFAFTHC